MSIKLDDLHPFEQPYLETALIDIGRLISTTVPLFDNLACDFLFFAILYRKVDQLDTPERISSPDTRDLKLLRSAFSHNTKQIM